MTFRDIRRLREDYIIGVPYAGVYSEVFTTDREEYGGSGFTNGTEIKSKKKSCHELENSITLTIPPLSVMYYKCTEKTPVKTKSENAEDKTETKIKEAVKVKKAVKVKVAVKAKSKKKSEKDEAKTEIKKDSSRTGKKTSKKNKE